MSDRVHLRRRPGRKTWEVHFTLNGKRKFRALGTTDRRIAEDLRAEMEVKLRRRELRLPREIPVESALEEYLVYQTGRRSPHGLRTDEGYLRRAIRSLGIEDLQKLQAADVIRYLVELSGLGRKPKTLNRVRESLHTFCSWAVDLDYLQSNPVGRVKRYPESAPEISYLPRADHEPLLQAFRERDPLLLPIVAVCLYAGVRRAEAIWLEVGDLDLRAGFLRIRAKRTGENGWQPKTRRNRAVPIAPALDSILRETSSPGSADSWAFLSPQGCRWDGDNLYDRFKRVVRAAGFPKLTLLDLRHTFGTMHAMNGKATWIIANWMGNSEQMVRRHYAAFIVEETRADVAF